MEELLVDRDGDGVPDILEAAQEKKRRHDAILASRNALRQLEQKRAQWSQARQRLDRTVARGIVIGGTLGFFWTGAADIANTDPWLGGLSAVVCPQVCKGCRGPIRYYHPHEVVYCSPARENIQDVHWTELSDREAQLRYAVVPGGMATVLAGSLLLWIPLASLVLFLIERRNAARKRRGVGDLDREIASERRKLDHLEGSAR